MQKRIVFVNGAAEARTLNPFKYSDPIKSLEISNEARVTIDGERVFRSAVTSGVDVKARTGRKYHLYIYATAEAAATGPGERDWIPITSVEYAEYRNNPASVIALSTTEPKAEEPVAEPKAEEPVAEPVEEPVEEPVAEPVEEPEPERAAEKARTGRRARREATEA